MHAIDSHPILTCPEAKGWERGLLQGESTEWTAMQRAGESIARSILEDFKEVGGFPKSGRVLVLAGKGHNGGDALLAARTILTLHLEARAVVVLCFGSAALRPLAARALEWLQRDAVGRVNLLSSEQALVDGETYALCFDGIFGFQFRPPLDGATTALLTKINAHPGIKLRAAVDLPSGVGETNAATIFRADFTYATGIVKQPVLSANVAPFVGRLRYLDLGFFSDVAGLGEPGSSVAKATDGRPGSPTPATERILTTQVLTPLTELRASQTDKRTFGHLFVVGGSRSYPGAVVLAVRAALRSGVGLVTAFLPERLAPEYAARHPEAMWVGCPETDNGTQALGTAALIRERLPRATALLVGPGLGAEPKTIAWVAQLLGEVSVPLVLDADALRPEVLEQVKDKPFICTPHAGEFDRIKGAIPASTGVLVLKGPMTRVQEGPNTYYSPFGGPVLARGGSGDILAGLIGSLLAQQPDDPLLAACRGVVWHGHAADLLARSRGQVVVEISEILEQLGPALFT